MTHVLVIDNYDSFVYTLNGYLEELGATTHVIRNDEVTAEELAGMLDEYDGVLLSPGPGAPHEAGVSLALVDLAVQRRVPVLGVCLGHQAIGEYFGGTVTHAEELMHGKTSVLSHTHSPFFAGVPEHFTATRYHSLAVVRDTVPEELTITAETESGIVMAFEHVELPLWGVQYHPESVMTEAGYRQLGNWLELIGLSGAAERSAELSPLIRDAASPAGGDPGRLT